jgi:hypothetical protein
VQNSTFTNNSVVRGAGGPGAGNGGDAGGAIFSHDGSVTVVDCTIADNHSTGSGAGIVVYSDSSASFTIDDTLIANNGANECIFTGSVTPTGMGNLIMSNGSGTQPFGACPGVVTNVDPQLGMLQDNGGPTPTMSIPLYSSAMSAADPATSLPYDQRYADRPQGGGWDIGAFQLCRRKLLNSQILQLAPCGETNVMPPVTTTLIMDVSPPAGGTTDPAPGSHDVELNSVVPITATTNPGWFFIKWTGPVGDAYNSSTTVAMYQSQEITALFDTTPPPPSRTPTPSASRTATTTDTPSPTPTATNTPLPMATATPADTSTPTFTVAATSTTTARPADTATPTSTTAPMSTATTRPADTATATLTVAPTPIEVACPGDCNRDGSVTVNELLTLVNIALGNTNVSACLAGDLNHDGQISISEILAAVNAALSGCPTV